MRSFYLMLALLALAWPAAAALPAAGFPIPKETTSDTGYTAIEVGPDGKVYVGTAWYGGSAHFIRLDPATGKWEDLFHAHQLTRDAGTGLDSQSKFHAKPLVDADRVVWVATKQGNEEFANRPEYGESATGFAGGHLFSFDTRTGRTLDHGILMKQEGIMGGAIDRARKRLYFVSDPKGHFLIYDIVKNSVRDLGRSGPTPRYMGIDAKGRVFAMGAPLPGDTSPGAVTMYDPATDKLNQLAVTVDGDPKEYRTPYVIVMNADGTKLLGAAMSCKYVLEYDLSTVKLNNANPYANGSITCRLAAGITPGDTHAGTLGKDGCFYFNSGATLYRYNPAARTAEEVGTIAPPNNRDGATVHSQGAAVGPDGTLYMKFIYPYQVLAFDKLTAPKGGK
ncbi:MAG: NHL repeat-containing protein [Armatimonadota bacterium]